MRCGGRTPYDTALALASPICFGRSVTDGSSSDPLDAARVTLRAVWGYDDFRPAQVDPLRAVLAGHDVLAILPTGGGKSLLYQVPAAMDASGLTLVVSPLVALIRDQVARLDREGVSAAFLDASVGRRKADQLLTNARFGQYRMLYVSPERLENDLFLGYAPHLPVSRIAVDEAHCVSLWGKNFRPSYRRIRDVRAVWPAASMVAVTASATPAVRRDIAELLGLRRPHTFVQGFDRPNLTYEVKTAAARDRELDAALRDVPDGSAIVYAATRRQAEEIGERLRRAGHKTAVYHGGMAADVRAAAQADWLAGRARVMVATNAFGMGIDKPDVRLVLHAHLPASLEAYYQEAGRAGRDGQPARALLLVSGGDADTQRALIERSHPTAAQARAVFDAALNLGQVAVGSRPEDAVSLDAALLAKLAGVDAALLEPTFRLLERAGAVRMLPSKPGTARLHVTTSPPSLRAYAEAQALSLRVFVLDLARHVPAEAFRAPVTVALAPLAKALGVDEARLQRGLDFLAERGVLAWHPLDGRIVFEALVERSKHLPLDDGFVRAARDAAEAGLDALLAYTKAQACRRVLIAAYFGEVVPACGTCDICRRTSPPDERALLQRLADTRRVPPEATPLLPAWVEAGWVTVVDAFSARYALTDAGRRALSSNPS